jgi:hypothetical protein
VDQAAAITTAFISVTGLVCVAKSDMALAPFRAFLVV